VALSVGTSGWNYPDWRSGFYKGVPQRRWLAHCAARFTGIEVNATFYRTMTASAFARWLSETPDGFPFALKGSRLVTHLKRLHDVDAALADVRASFAAMGGRLACVLWQLPPGLGKDIGRLRAFAEALSGWKETRHAVEFRNDSWFDAETARLLDDFDLANCISDAPRWPMWEKATGGLAYVRLHGHEQLYVSEYGTSGLRPWARKIARWLAAGLAVHVYFDNTDGGAAPADATLLLRMLDAERPAVKGRALP
jgi:uncharacterized protein YecE (DUF72 family)